MWRQLEAVDWLRGYGTRASCGQLLYPWPQVTRVIIDYYLAVQHRSSKVQYSWMHSILSKKNERVYLSQSFSLRPGTACGLTRLAFYKGICLLSSLLEGNGLHAQVCRIVLNFKALGLGVRIACRHCWLN